MRPAPMPPSGRRHSSSSGGQVLPQEQPTSPRHEILPQETPPPQYSASLPSTAEGMHASFEGERWLSQEGYGTEQDFSTLESGQHMVVDLNITQTESEAPEYEVGGARVERERVGLSPNSISDDTPPPNHARSASDSILLNTNSNSLPDLVREDNQEDSSSSPEEVGYGGVAPLPSLPGAGSYRHTRHLSLMGGRRSNSAYKEGRKKKPKRASSIKQRSRSPPNLPPPPPPPERAPPEGQGAESTEHVDGLSPPSHSGLARNPVSTTSLGFSEVMSTITNIDQQLDQMAEQYTTFKPQQAPPTAATPPKTPPSATPRNVANILFNHPKLGLFPATGSGGGGSDAGSGFVEDEWLCDLPTSSSDHTPHTLAVRSPGHDVGPPLRVIADHTHNGGPAESAKPAKAKHHVMFKEEVEDIPSYEPRVDETSPPPEDELLTGVAAIKAKLFGSHEKEAVRYKKEGMLSPKYMHPVNMTFPDHYFGNGSAQEVPPNINNNNSASEDDSEPILQQRAVTGGVVSTDEALVKDTLLMAGSGGAGRGESPPTDGKKAETSGVTTPEDPAEPDQNLYDAPWEKKAVSKYKVIGVRRRSASPGQGKEKTPPPAAPKRLGPKIQIAEVSVEETPRPLTTAEVRNVHSLERKHSNEKAWGRGSVSPPMGGVASESSLLASISNTLQATSRYGSDSLLNNGESLPSQQGGGPTVRKSSGEVKISSRGELEKIRAAHRKETTPNVPRPPLLTQASTRQNSLPQLFTSNSNTPPSHTPKVAAAVGVAGSQPQLYPSPNHTPYKSGGVVSSQPSTPSRSAGIGLGGGVVGIGGGVVGLGGGVAGWGVTRSQPQLYPQTTSANTMPSHAPRSTVVGVAKGSGLRTAPHGIATSMEGLQKRPDTHVTYDAQTQAHIFRSLV